MVLIWIRDEFSAVNKSVLIDELKERSAVFVLHAQLHYYTTLLYYIVDQSINLKTQVIRSYCCDYVIHT